MSTLLINPASDFVTFKVHETLGLGYLASALEQQGHDVEIYDCNFQDADPEAIAQRVRDAEHSVVGIATMIGKTAHALDVAAAVRSRSDAFVVLGGYTATYEYEEILQKHTAVDAVVRGEAEIVLPDLVTRVCSGQSWQDLKGLAFLTDNRVTTNPLATLHMALDDMPFPRRSPHLDRIGLASILTSRGCYAKCSFCNIQEFYNLAGFGGVRVRSAKNVVDEIELIHQQYGIRKFLFIDDDMLGADFYAAGRNTQLAKEILTRGLDIDFELAGRANDVIRFEETLQALRQAGLSRVYVGIESGADSQLKRQRKGVRKHHNVAALDVLKRRGLGLDMGFIPFDPWSTPEETVENFQFLDDMGVMEAANLNSAAVTMIMYPGTALYERAKTEGLFLRAARFTYAYRFAHEEHAPLFTRIIHTIKRKPVLDAVDRFIGAVKADSQLRAETTRILDPAARYLFGRWTELFSIWCRGGDDEELAGHIDAVEALVSNFCYSGVRLRSAKQELGPAPDARAARLLKEVSDQHEALAGALGELDRALGLRLPPVERPEFFADLHFADRCHAARVDEFHRQSTDPSRRHLLTSPGQVEKLPTADSGTRFTIPFDLVTGVPPSDQTLYLGLRLVVPSDVMDNALYADVTSQMEKADASVDVGLAWRGSPRVASQRVTKGWSEVEFEVPGDRVGDAAGLVVGCSVPLEADLEIHGRWWRTS